MPSAHLDPDKIKAELKTKRIGREIIVYKSTASTNDVAAKYAKNAENDGLVVFAEQQTKGRGRSGSQWQSPPGESILCSVLLIGDIPEPELLSLTAAVAVAQTVAKPGRDLAKVKWPNDILIDGKKIAGILIESKAQKTHATAIIGIGINCRQKEDSFPPQLQKLATSLEIESNSKCDLALIARRLLTEFDHWLAIALKDGDKVIEKWLSLSIHSGRRLTLTYNGKEFIGHCIGIDPRKGLTLQLDSGSRRFFPAAQSSINRTPSD